MRRLSTAARRAVGVFACRARHWLNRYPFSGDRCIRGGSSGNCSGSKSKLPPVKMVSKGVCSACSRKISLNISSIGPVISVFGVFAKYLISADNV